MTMSHDNRVPGLTRDLPLHQPDLRRREAPDQVRGVASFVSGKAA